MVTPGIIVTARKVRPSGEIRKVAFRTHAAQSIDPCILSKNMKATITIVAMAVTAWAVGPQRGLAQYGPAPMAMPGPMGPGASPYAVQPAFYPAMAPAPYPPAGPYVGPPGYGFYPASPVAYQEPNLALPAGNGPSLGGYPPGAPLGNYGAPPAELPYGDDYLAGSVDSGAAVCEDCGSLAGECGCGMGLAPVFFGLEGLLWVRHGQQVPPLVTTSPAGTAQAAAGVLGAPGTTIVFGGQRIEDGFVPGFRMTSGVWLDPMHEVALGGRIFFLGTDEVEFNANSPTGQPIIARPFVDFNSGLESAFLVAFDNGLLVNPRTGSINVQVSNDLWGGDAYSSLLLTQGMGYRIDLQAGYQYYRIDEAVAITSQSVRGDVVPPFNIPAEATIAVSDIFDTQNEFHGGALGALTELQQGAFSLKFLGRVAVGNMNQRVRIDGRSVITDPIGGVREFPAGILAQPSNIGEISRNRTVVSPEANITVGYNYNQNITLTMGYSFIYWTNVAQAGPHINRVVDVTQVNAVPAPPAVMATDFWVMGLNGGLEWRY